MDKRVKCPACGGVAFVRANKVGDSFLTCPRCGPWNGRGAAYRNWCDSLPALPELSKPEPEPVPGIEPEKMPAANDEQLPVEKQDDWLNEWGSA
ncbi:hypothetical protein [Reinekea thalattae]|uniref:Uncharacterized protein n=1 Tax=Reinekea thalattae TaxID=2593301 RepID=A0A5C8Z4D8_9GAMM|nr:hypothetical protein [Reinekea thalattae]TXR52058.1 hypothetical protein FME95_11625 [Reinekea thalattae]